MSVRHSGGPSQRVGSKALGLSVESYGGLLSSILLNKVPSEILLIVNRGLLGDSWDLDKILELFEAELTARERTAPTHQLLWHLQVLDVCIVVRVTPQPVAQLFQQWMQGNGR